MLRLTGKVAVITGSGRKRGLGEAIARRLAQEGCAIVLSDIGRPRDAATAPAHVGQTGEALEIARQIESMGAKATYKDCDVRVPAEIEALADHAVSTFGGIDIWVNNAGIGYIMKPLLEVTEADWDAVLDVNLRAVSSASRQRRAPDDWAGPRRTYHQHRKPGGEVGFPHAQAYTSSKHGLVGLARSAAVELGAYGITVNNVCPNHVTTGLGAWQNEYFSKVVGAASVEDYLKAMAARIPLGRAGLPEDTAAAVAFLCTDDARYITAESMNVSGGEEPH